MNVILTGQQFLSKTTRFRKRILTSDWSENSLVIVSDFFEHGDFIYLLAADSSNETSVSEFSNCGIYAPYGVYDSGYIELACKKQPTEMIYVIFIKIDVKDGNGNVFCSSGFWFNEDGIIQKDKIFISSTEIIPKGRMVGDVTGDGNITTEDKELVLKEIVSSVTFDDTQRECADVDGDKNISANDANLISQLAEGFIKLGEYSRDVLGNWTINPTYETDEAQFYIDISAPSLTANSNIILVVQENRENQILRVRAMDGKFRVYAKFLPIEDVPYILYVDSIIETLFEEINHKIGAKLLVSSHQTIPAGRMKGDVNGDGKITSEDATLVLEVSTGSSEFTEIQIECADVDGDGMVSSVDSLLVGQMANGRVPIGRYSRDVLGNWSVNPDYATDEAQFYIDISVSGLTSNSDIALAVYGDEMDRIVRVETMSDAFRVYAKLLPINSIPYKLIQ